MDMIQAIADRYGLAVVEDACQAHGATFRGRRAGSFGHGALSLYATKNMTTAEGGFVTTNDDKLADWLRRYRNQGMRSRYQFEMLGYNFRMTDLAAAIGHRPVRQARRATPRAGRRSPLATTRHSGSCRSACRSRRTAGPTSSTSTRSTSASARDAIVADLREAGVGADIYYPIPVHRQAYIMERGLHADLPVTEAAAARTLALPMFPGLTDAEQGQVIDAMRAAVERHARPRRPDRPTAGVAAT